MVCTTSCWLFCSWMVVHCRGLEAESSWWNPADDSLWRQRNPVGEWVVGGYYFPTQQGTCPPPGTSWEKSSRSGVFPALLLAPQGDMGVDHISLGDWIWKQSVYPAVALLWPCSVVFHVILTKNQVYSSELELEMDSKNMPGARTYDSSARMVTASASEYLLPIPLHFRAELQGSYRSCWRVCQSPTRAGS